MRLLYVLIQVDCQQLFKCNLALQTDIFSTTTNVSATCNENNTFKALAQRVTIMILKHHTKCIETLQR